MAPMILQEMTHAHVRLGSGGLAIQLPLIAHVTAGVLGVITGYVAISVAKGGQLHKQSGRIFVYAMVTMALLGAGIAVYEAKLSSVVGGVTTAYMVVTALTTVRPVTPGSRRLEYLATLIAVTVGVANLTFGFTTLASGATTLHGVPVGVLFMFGVITLLSAASDVRMYRIGSLTGVPRLTRHLWRMCFGLFIAAGSFFLGQAHLFPKQLQVFPLLAIPAFAPLVIMVYWVWRIRVRRKLSGIVVASPSQAAA